MNIEPGMIPGQDEELSLIIGEPESHYVYEDIDFKGINEVDITIMQHPQYLNGGTIEFRMDSLGGDLITSMSIEQGLLDLGPLDLAIDVCAYKERHDLYMLFRSEENAPICAVTKMVFTR